MHKTVAAAVVCGFGICLSAMLTTNAGWVIFDIFDHYISNYIVVSVGLMQCISVGWIFEAESTSMMSEGHKLGQRWLGVLYWIPVVILTFYAHFGFSDES